MKNEEQPKITELTEDEQRKLAELIAKKWIEIEIKVTKELINEVMTPFWVKWWRKLKKTYGGGEQ